MFEASTALGTARVAYRAQGTEHHVFVRLASGEFPVAVKFGARTRPAVLVRKSPAGPAALWTDGAPSTVAIQA